LGFNPVDWDKYRGGIGHANYCKRSFMKSKSSSAWGLIKVVIFLILIQLWVWGCFALFFSGPDPEWLKISLSIFFGLTLPTAFFFGKSFVKSLILCMVTLTILMVWWQTLVPLNTRDWAADVAQISHGEMQGDKLIMYNVRNFFYTSETDVIENWETREYDLTKLQGLDLFVSYWASDHIAHTIMSWDFGEDGHLAISIETRKEKTEEYSAVKGFFKQFELSYVAADEKDIIKLRTHHRNERVYLYRLLAEKKGVRVLLDNYLAEMNQLVKKPKFYNAFSRNCTTTIRLHANAIQPDRSLPLDWRIILSGHLDEFLYERKSISQKLPFEELRALSRINEQTKNDSKDNYSEVIRANLLDLIDPDLN